MDTQIKEDSIRKSVKRKTGSRNENTLLREKKDQHFIRKFSGFVRRSF
jgi:hypothetical protein